LEDKSLNNQSIARLIDHAVLKPDVTISDLFRECEIAKTYQVFSVCVKPSFIGEAVKILSGSGVLVSTVIGFPHGGMTMEAKTFEAKDALFKGAHELDMVLNIGKLKSGEFSYVEEEIASIVSIAKEQKAIVKVILETALLSDEEKTEACRIAVRAGAHYVKTSTGFSGGGATLDDVALMKSEVSLEVKVKASGGIKTYEQALAFYHAGCERLGTSATEAIVKGCLNEDKSSY
jgi:deoxyribose-phosphate aldolase